MTNKRDSDTFSWNLSRVWCLTTVVAAVISTVTVGCVQPEVVARFNATGFQKYQSCMDRLFPLETTFGAARDRIDSTGFFWSTNKQPTYDMDLVYLEVFDREAARNSAGTPVQFVYRPEMTGQPMRMELHPERSCPNDNISLIIEGSVSFESFAEKPGRRVVGELVSGEIIDARTGDTVATSMTGEWDFKVENGYPAQFFPSYDSDEYKRNP